GLGNATYQVVIRDAANTNCTITLNSNLTITQPTALSATVTSTNVTCNGANDGTISVTNPAGGYGTFQYSINNGGTWQDSGEFSGLGNATYHVVIRDKANTNCTITLNSNLTITQPSPLNGDISTQDISCFDVKDGSIIISNPSGGYGNFEFSLDSISWQTDANFENLSPGIFTVYIRDADNSECVVTLSSSVEISQPEILTSSLVSQDNVECKGFATGAATINASGGTAPYTYSWGAFGTGATKTDLSAGTYSVIVTDANGCETQPLEVVITEPNSFIEIANISTTSGCHLQNNGTATAEVQGGTGSYSYLWSNGQTTQTATGLAPGNYSVTVKDGNLCETQKSVTITAPAELIITEFHTTGTTYFGSETGTSTVLISGGTANYTFLWSNGQTSQTARNLAAGTYSVTVTDANGCKKTGSTEVFDAIAADIVGSSVCEDKKSEIRIAKYSAINVRGGSGSYTYSWDFGADAVPATATGPGEHIVEYSQIGQKNITLTITSGSQTFQTTYDQYVAICFSTCSSQDLSVGDIYIGNQAGVRITDTDCQNNPNPTGIAIWAETPFNSPRYTLYMEYIFYITHSDGRVTTVEGIYCDPDQSTPIGVKRKIVDIDYNCSDAVSIEKFYLAVNQQVNRECLDGAQPKCFSTGEAKLVTAPFYASAIATELLCNGSSDGSIRIRATGGIAPYQYRLTKDGVPNEFQAVNNQPNLFEGLAAGTYTIEVRDNSATPKTFSFLREIIQPTDPLILQEFSRTDVTCFGGSNGSATVVGSGGTPKTSGNPYVYVWENGQTTATIGNLAAGVYPVRVIDANGCEESIDITITQPEIILANAGPDQVLSCGNNSTYLQAVYDVSNPELGTWSIINGPSGASIDDIHNPQAIFTGVQGTYTLRWTVPCGATDDVKITISNCNTVDFDGINDHIDFGDNFNLSGDFTIEAWVKQDPGKTAGIKTVLSKRDANDLTAGFDLIVEDNIPKFRWNNSSLESSYPIGTDRWYHIAVIKGGTNAGLYVDGILVGTGSPGTPSNLTQPFMIGAMHDSATPFIPSNYFHGWIEEVRIWNTANTKEQLRFMMNQKLQNIDGKVRGLEIPVDVPGSLAWASLIGYYQLELSENGLTPGKIAGSPAGKLINITTTQQRTAPLPYISTKAGQWHADATWLRPQVWDPPHSLGIDGATTIDWNIARISHNISSEGKNIKVLGLLSNGEKLTIANTIDPLNENNSGQSLTVTHYLKLNGIIDLVGESQLIQTDSSTPGQSIVSILEESSTGFLERDQQGTANSFNYNYWSSPVSIQEAANNSTYTIGSVMLDGTNTANPLGLSFDDWHEFADGPYATPRKISNYWLYKFRGTVNVYSEWERVGSIGTLLAGEGYTMKGTSGGAAIADRQNYVFKGKPNNGTITLNIGTDQNYLLGNPYPSAIDVNEFILDNLNDHEDGGNSGNVFNGAVYFWDHFAGKSHILLEYIGGYATRNLIDGVPAVSNDARINANDSIGTKIPGPYIPVAQGFFINTSLDPEFSNGISVQGGDVIFRNSQRAFVKETNAENSLFLRPENPTKGDEKIDKRQKIRLDFRSPMGYHRQILVGVDENASDGFDLGYDAPLNDYNAEDMFWMIENNRYVIQGVSNFDLTQVLKLGVRIKEAGELSIKINKLENISEEVNIYLKDKTNSTYHDLRESNFKLKLEKGEINNRFEIVFQKEKDPEPDPEPEPKPIEEINPEILPPGTIDVIFAENEHKLMILNPFEMNINQVEIYNMLGQKIESFTSNSNQKEMIVPVREHPAAIYVVKVYAVEGMVSKNILLMR
ncbi:LamG-like jellyroll fold domain-containing protein, partial [Gillisia sp. Q332]|uniref:LamG-like jellyroll fold domain-containing protein n=1 Tax=Gillisia xinjiangensis TaxID=3384765 RepID=UPI00391DAAF4